MKSRNSFLQQQQNPRKAIIIGLKIWTLTIKSWMRSVPESNRERWQVYIFPIKMKSCELCTLNLHFDVEESVKAGRPKLSNFVKWILLITLQCYLIASCVHELMILIRVGTKEHQITQGWNEEIGQAGRKGEGVKNTLLSLT